MSDPAPITTDQPISNGFADSEPREIGPTPGHILGNDDVVLEALERAIDEGPGKVEKLEGRQMSAAELEFEQRWITKVCEEVDIRLRRDHSMRCPSVAVESQGFGYRFHCYDRENRLYLVDYRTEWAYDLPSAKSGGDQLGREMIADVVSKVLLARDEYFRRLNS